jgi:hypothetical protein
MDIEDINIFDLGLGRSIYSRRQLEEMERLQRTAGTRLAYMPGSAEEGAALSGRASGECVCCAPSMQPPQRMHIASVMKQCSGYELAVIVMNLL